MATSKDQYGKLESLRGVAACLVVFYHSPFNFGSEPILFMRNAYLLVDFFFILSGFVMTHAYFQKIRNGMPFSEYIMLRLGRIYPLHIFTLLLWVPFLGAKYLAFSRGLGSTNPFHNSTPYAFAINVLLLHSLGFTGELSWNSPSWSISAEFVAYALFFAGCVTLDKKRGLLFPLAVAFSVYAFLLSLGKGRFDFTHDFGALRCLVSFYLGSFAFRVRPAFGNLKLNQNLMELLSTSMAVAALLLAGKEGIFIPACLLSFLAMILVFSSGKSGLLGRMLESAAFRRIGLWSYSIYMVHDIIMVALSNLFEFVLKINPSRPFSIMAIVLNAAALSLIILVSRFTFIHIERYFRDLVKRELYAAGK